MKTTKLSIFVGLVAVFFALSSVQAIYAEKNEHATGNGKSEHTSTFGKVEQVHGNSLTIEDKEKKESLEANFDKNTKVMGKDNKTLRLNQIKLHDTVAVVGSESGELGKKQLHAIKVFVKQASDSAQMKRRAVEGVVSSISGSTITLVHQIHQDRISTITVTATTLIKLKGTEAATLASIQVGQLIVAIGDLGSNGTIIAKRIHVIPGKAKGFMGKLPSITPSSSPSATISPTVSITPSVTDTVTPTLTATPTNTPTP